jgi:hypothetical protein
MQVLASNANIFSSKCKKSLVKLENQLNPLEERPLSGLGSKMVVK